MVKENDVNGNGKLSEEQFVLTGIGSFVRVGEIVSPRERSLHRQVVALGWR